MKKTLLTFLFTLSLVGFASVAFAGDSSICTAPPAIGECPAGTPDYYFSSSFGVKACQVRYDCGATNANCDTGTCTAAPPTYACPYGNPDWAPSNVNIGTSNCCTDGQVVTWDDAGNRWTCADTVAGIWSTNVSGINYDGGKVGIGTGNPDATFDINAPNVAGIGGLIEAGYNTSASGDHSSAIGYIVEASGGASNAMGWSTVASGKISTAMGFYTTAQSYVSVTIGRHNVVSGVYSTDSWVETDPLFVIGNGTNISPSNAMTVLKNGNVGIGTASPAYTLDVLGDINFTGNITQNGVLFSGGSAAEPDFVGVSITLKNGAQGGYASVDLAECGAGNHVCTADEMLYVVRNNDAQLASTTGLAWYSSGAPTNPTMIVNDCNGWTFGADGSIGATIWDFDNNKALMSPCNQLYKFACCN